jgi:Transglutaminase-like superfamily
LSASVWRTAARLPWADRLLFVEALTRLGAARLFVRLFSGKAVLTRLGPQMETPNEDDPASHELLRRIRWAILAASRRAPWRCKCLEQAIAGKWMLRSRGYATTLYLGLARRDAVEAHAWLRCGSHVVTGGAGAARFVVISKFGEAR